jgi:predicted DNA-binding protein
VVYAASMRLIRTNIYLRVDHHKKLKAISAKTGESVAELVRKSIEEYLKKK